jgi:glycosyltransferase involved in cell wall biosynthesis
MATAKITTVIPTYNVERYLGECLSSIARQNYANSEVIIIDGGSTDDTAKVAARYSQIVSRFVSEPDRGQADAVTKGLRLATGDIAHWQAADDIVLPGAFARVAKEFATRPDVDLVFSNSLAFDEHRVFAGDDVRWVNFWTALLYFGRFQSECAYWRHGITTCGLPLDCSKPLTCDEDFFLRLWAGHKHRWVRQRLGAFRVRPGQISQVLSEKRVPEDRKESRQLVLRTLNLSKPRLLALQSFFWLPYVLGTWVNPKLISVVRFATRRATLDYSRRRYSQWLLRHWVPE